MVIVLRVHGLNRTIKNFTKYGKNVRTAGNAAIANLAKFSAAEYIRQAKSAGIQKFGASGNSIFDRIRALKKGDGHWVVTMPTHGIYQDRMKPHYVSVRNRRNLLTWTRRNYQIRNPTSVSRKSEIHFDSGGKVVSGALYVTPRPFISKANARIRAKAKEQITREFRRRGL